jgi:hypothetical protein
MTQPGSNIRWKGILRQEGTNQVKWGSNNAWPRRLKQATKSPV